MICRSRARTYAASHARAVAGLVSQKSAVEGASRRDSPRHYSVETAGTTSSVARCRLVLQEQRFGAREAVERHASQIDRAGGQRGAAAFRSNAGTMASASGLEKSHRPRRKKEHLIELQQCVTGVTNELPDPRNRCGGHFRCLTIEW